MKKLIVVIAFFLSQQFCLSTFAQTISGTINSYAAVTRIASANLTLNDATGFVAGDKVLVIQMQGAIIDTSNTPGFGDIINYNGAGNYEFAMIVGVSGKNITLQYPLCRVYDLNGSVQVVKVATYNNVTVNDTLTCQPWNGGTGGVLVLEVSGTLTLNADIEVSGKGFRGGLNTNGGYNPFMKYWYVSTALTFNGAGQKGESIARFIFNKDGGRGKQAAGGGGANPVQCGGGGGGNYGAGGLGGYGFSPYIKQYKDSTVQGIGGAALNYSQGQIFMGSGGGGGCADNGHFFTPGTNGGGIVIITAKNIVGNSFSIRANGIDQLISSSDEGAGGSGAGGCILLNVQNYTTNLNIKTRGGKGCDNDESAYFSGACHGTGGGGGAGLLWLSLSATPVNLIYDGAGGLPGMGINPICDCYNTSFGATAGQSTPAPLFNLVLPPLPIGPIHLADDKTVCSGATVMLNPSSGPAYSYTWTPETGLNCTDCANPSASPTVTTTYSVQGINGFCSDADQVIITVAGISADAGIITAIRDTICEGTPGFLSVTGNTGNVHWQSSLTPTNFSDLSGANNTSYTAILTYSTFFRVLAGTGTCGDTSSTFKLTVKPSPVAAFTSSISGLQVAFNSAGSSGDITIYEWDFGDGSAHSNLLNPVHNFTKADTFNVCLTVYNGSNCSFTICRDIDMVTTGVETFNAEDNFIIYPNPANGSFTLSSESFKGIVRIYNAMGQMVYNSIVDTNNVLVNDIKASGIYLIEWISEKGKSRNMKLVVQ